MRYLNNLYLSKAIGRVIRHKLDYGAILLCDQRFASPDLIKQLSSWVRSRVATFPKMGPLLRDLGIFFRNADIVYPGSAKAVRAPVVQDSSRKEIKKNHSTVDSYSHALSSNSSRVTSSHLKTVGQFQDMEQIDLAAYSTSAKPTLSQERSIFDGSELPTNLIDFNETYSSASTSKSEPNPTACQPAVKKRKITIISDAEKAKYDRRRMKEASSNFTQLTPCLESSTSMSNSSILTQPAALDSKRENASEYLKSVKSLLEPAGYSTFSNMIKTYRSEKNLCVLIATLKRLFLQDTKLRRLFKGGSRNKVFPTGNKITKNNLQFVGFRMFVAKEQISQFDEECSRLEL